MISKNKAKSVWLGLVFLAVVIAIGSVLFINMKDDISHTSEPVKNPGSLDTALLAGGCFWCVEADLEKLPGVVEVVSGYAGGESENPTYENYAASGHREVVEVTYNPDLLSYSELIYYHLKHIDPTDGEGSFADRGINYSPALYYQDGQEKEIAQAVLAKLDSSEVYDKPLAVAVEERPTFYPAEDYHQDYYKNNSWRYKFYRQASGRDAFIKKHWGEEADVVEEVLESDSAISYPWESFTKPAPDRLREQLTDLQYKVTQNDGTEKAFANPYDNHYEAGIYVDILSGEPLFSSSDKYDSGTGWPSFVKPITPGAVSLHQDRKLFVTRTEVRSRYADSHLGHVFADGPANRGGQRYCMNSAALRFVPQADMAKEGYEDFLQYVE